MWNCQLIWWILMYLFKQRSIETFCWSEEISMLETRLCNFRWSLNFSSHIMNSTRPKIGFSCTNFLRSIVVLVFAIISALHNFRSYSFRNKMINLVLLIKYRFDFRLQFDINKKCISEGFTEILLKNGTYN